MNTCTYSTMLGAYHDGELSPADRLKFEAHLAQCPACAAELEQLSRLTGVFAAFEPPRISPEALRRIANQPPVWAHRGYLHFVEALTGIAAAILLAASGWMIYQQRMTAPASSGSTPAITYAINPEQLDTSDTGTPLPDWVDDLAGQQRAE